MAKHKKRILQTFSVTGSLQKTKNYFKKIKNTIIVTSTLFGHNFIYHYNGSHPLYLQDLRVLLLLTFHHVVIAG